MGPIIGRGLGAYAAAVLVAVVLGIIVTVVLSGDTACPEGGCTITVRLSQIAAYAIIYGYSAFFLSLLFVIPYLIIFVGVVRAGLTHPLVFAAFGVAFAVLVLAFGPPHADVSADPSQMEIFASNITSSVGICGMIIGAIFGIVVWDVERRMRPCVHG